MAVTGDCRIGGTANFKIKAGETWQAQLNVFDANNSPIPLAGFVIGPLEVFDRSGTVIFTIASNEFTPSGSATILKKNTPDNLLKNVQGHNFKCPFLPPGGTPRAIVTGKVKVY